MARVDCWVELEEPCGGKGVTARMRWLQEAWRRTASGWEILTEEDGKRWEILAGCAANFSAHWRARKIMFFKLFPPKNLWSGLDVGENYLLSDISIKKFKLKVVQTVCGAGFHWKVQILIFFTSDTKILATVLWISVGSPLTFFLLELLKTFQVFLVNKIFRIWTVVPLLYQEEPFLESIVTLLLAAWAWLSPGAFAHHRSWWGSLLSCCFSRHGHLLLVLQLLCPSEVKWLIPGFCTLSQAWNWQLHCYVSGKVKCNIRLWELEMYQSIGEEINAIAKFWALGGKTHHPRSGLRGC